MYREPGRCVLTSRPVLLAFAAFVVLAGSNAAAVKAVLGEMPPFWSAGLRFVLAGALLLALMVIQRRPAPRGDRLLGTVLFGVFGFALAYFFLYQAIGDAGSGTTMTVLAIVPLLTVLLSVVHGIERPRLLGVVGALIAAAGIVIVAADQLSLNVPTHRDRAAARRRRSARPRASSSSSACRPATRWRPMRIGMLLGGTLLVAASLVAQEPLALPTQSDTLLGMAYLIGPGSIGVFMLALYVLARWTASATSYAFLLFPLVAIVLGARALRRAGPAVVPAGRGRRRGRRLRRGDLPPEGRSRGARARRGVSGGVTPDRYWSAFGMPRGSRLAFVGWTPRKVTNSPITFVPRGESWKGSIHGGQRCGFSLRSTAPRRRSRLAIWSHRCRSRAGPH